jgi:SAM-dependent methyltransferase
MSAGNAGSDIYLRVREKEGRLYSDEVLKELPAISANHPFAGEWRARAASSHRLTAYLERARSKVILELGCGNGWLANRMADATGTSVVGLEKDNVELFQARRVFAHRRQLSWIAGDIFCGPFAERSFDSIVIASAIQYFPNVPCLIQALVPILREGGEIHILDSPLYAERDIAAARERSKRYYEQLGFPEMAAHYHHHSPTAFAAYNADWLYTPRLDASRRNDALQDSPFPWVRLRPRVCRIRMGKTARS